MAQKIPATVITGFLGAGKTSLIRHMAENSDGKKLAFLINEFGDLGMDREMLTGCGIEGCTEADVVELVNGCICCTVADDFLPSMEALLDRAQKPDHILIETSGLALPKPLVKAFDWPEIRPQVTVDGVIAVVDSKAVKEGRFAADEEAIQALRAEDENLAHDNPLQEVFEDQLLCADMVVLNKVDLLTEAEIASVEAELRKGLRTGVRFVRSAGAKVDPSVLLGLNAGAEDDLAGRKSHHDDHDDHDHDDFETFTLELEDVEDADAFQAGIMRIVKEHDVLRVKGFINRPGVVRREVIQGVGPRISRYFDRAWKAGEIRKTRLVVIGRHGLDQDAIEAALKA